MNKRITIAALAAILLLAVFLRIGLVREELFYPDSCVYLSMAENMKEGVFSRSIFPQTALHQPLYSLLTAAVSLAGPTVETAGMAVSVLSGLGLVLVLFFAGRRLGGQGAGLTAALLAACDPALITYSTELLTESLFLCLFYLVLLLVLRAGAARRPMLAAGCGALAAAAFGARFIGLAALPVAFCWVVLFRSLKNPQESGPRFRRAAAAGLLVILGFTLVASPVLLRNRVVRGEWSLTGFASPAAVDPVVGTDRELKDDDGETSGMLPAWLERYRGMRAGNAVDLTLGGYLAEFWRVFRETVPLAWTILALAGVVTLVFLRGAAGLFPAGYLASWLLLPMGITFIAQSASGSDEISRYLMPVLPALLILAAIGLAAPAAWLGKRMESRAGGGKGAGAAASTSALLVRLAAPLGAGIVLVLLLNSGPLQALKNERENQSESTSWVTGARDVAEFVRKWTAESGIYKPTVMDRKPFVAYFSGCWWRNIPNSGPRKLAGRCYRSRTHLVVVDSAAVALYLPNLAPLVSGEYVPPGLRLVYHRIFSEQERVLAVYQVLYFRQEGRVGMERWDGLDDLAEATADQHAQSGRRLYGEGLIHQAGLHFQRATKLRPDFAQAWYQLGSCYFRKSLYLLPEQRHLGAFHKAIRCYREAAGLSPRLAAMAHKEMATLERNLPPAPLSRVYTKLGRLYQRLERTGEARSAFNRALAIDPGNDAARDGLNQVLPAGSMEVPDQT